MATRSAARLPSAEPVLYTIGHSTRGLDEFLALLRAHEIELVADIRTIPKSRHNPQFNTDRLASGLERAGVRYAHLPALGGLRHPAKDSINRGWRNASFRGFADYMGTPEFERGLRRLETLAGQRRTAIMCAEAVPWRCHRSLVADALSLKGWRIRHIQSQRTAVPHALTSFLRVRAGKPTYPEREDSGGTSSA
jgi:uncharacterized protein (DUF488 family)